MIERSEIQFGLTAIPFKILRSDKRATVALTIEDRGKLVVTAPAGVAVDRINSIVRTKAPWVLKRMKTVSDRPPPPSSREFVTGETVLYLGRQLRLKVIDETPGNFVLPRIWVGWYEVPVPTRMHGGPRRREVRRRLAGSLKEHADLFLPTQLARVCRLLSIEPPSMFVRDQKKRWGSCDAEGVLRFNWRIIQAPVALIDYVLVHELVHLTYPSHGPEFWKAVQRWMPDFEERRARLREIGPRLEW